VIHVWLATFLNNIKLGATDANHVASQLKQHRDPYCFRRLHDRTIGVVELHCIDDESAIDRT